MELGSHRDLSAPTARERALAAPFYIHQIWFDIGHGSSPPHPDRSARLRELNPEYKYVLWDYARATVVVQSFDHAWHDLWTRLPHHINRIDMFRYILMYVYGGVYLDLDFVCVQPLAPLLRDQTVLLSEEWPYSFSETVHNGALFSGSVKHSFWRHVISLIALRLNDSSVTRENMQDGVFKLTGTALLRDAVVIYWGLQDSAQQPVLVTPFYVCSPIMDDRGTLVESYEHVPPRATWRKCLVHTMPRNPSVFTYIASAEPTWQKSFQANSTK